MPGKMSLVEIEPESLILSALKKAEEGEAVILRLYNTVPQTIHTEVGPFTIFDLTAHLACVPGNKGSLLHLSRLRALLRVGEQRKVDWFSFDAKIHWEEIPKNQAWFLEFIGEVLGPVINLFSH
jgi:hypothetical protein